MKLTWLGHSCFAVESGGYRVGLDPYYVESYPPLHTSANEVLCSQRTPSTSSLPRGCASCISATSVTS